MFFSRRAPSVNTTIPTTPPLDAAASVGTERATFAAGCFWGVESAFRAIPGVTSTAAGYTGGHTPAPTYREVCTGRSGHAEAVEVWFDPTIVRYGELLDAFWQIHDPTSANRQGFDLGSQYRSVIFTHDAVQEATARASLEREQPHRRRPIATEIMPATVFHRAEDYHQQYHERSGRISRAISVARPPALATTDGGNHR